MYEKENASPSYQVRTRQYSNINLREQSKNYEKRYEMKVQKHQNRDSPYRYKRPNILQTYNRFENSQSSDKYEMYNLRSKDNVRQIIYQNANMGRESEGTSMNIQNRRQGSRKQQLQMRMNNINTINDKINNLLNLVKKERVYQSKQKIQECPSKFFNRSSSTINRERKISAVRQPQQKIEPKVNDKDQDSAYIKLNNKSLRRLRELSTLEPNLINKQPRGREKANYSPVQYNNQEDERKEWDHYSFSPANMYRNDSIQKVKRFEADEQKTFQSIGSNKIGSRYNNYSPISTQKMRSNGSITHKNGDRLLTPSKYEIINYGHDGSNRLDKAQPASPRSNFSSNYLPLTVIQNGKQIDASPRNNNPSSYSGMKSIENQIKRIKEKMGEFDNPYNNRQKIQQAHTRKQVPPNFTIKADPNSPGKQFELKLYPVKSDRPQTVKIAEKLCFQIQIDGRMKKEKDGFVRIQGEQKWKELNEKLSKFNIRFTINELKAFILSANGNNGQFHTEQASSKKIQALAQQFAESQRFWEKHVIGCANLKTLRRQGFDARELDKNSQGCLKIEDITNFVNEFTAHSYKTSDLLTVFRRLQLLEGGSSSEKVEYSTFMQAFTM